MPLSDDPVVLRPAGATRVLRERMELPTKSLMPGMFVAALDRPWVGTPFLIQGFVIDDPVQITTLREYCSTVVIDPRRSDPDSLRSLDDLYLTVEEAPGPSTPAEDTGVRVRYVQHAGPDTDSVLPFKRLKEGLAQLIAPSQPMRPTQGPARPQQEEANAGRPRALTAYNVSTFSTAEPRPPLRDAAAAQPALKAPPPQPTERIRLADLLGAVADEWDRLLERFTRRDKPTPAAILPRRRRSDRARVRPLATPREIIIYRDSNSVQDELPRARAAVAATEDVLALLRQDLVIEGQLRVDGLPAAVEGLVASVARNRDALIWVARVRQLDAELYSRGIQVAAYLLALGRQLGFPSEDLHRLALIGLLMDAGKSRLDPALLKHPGSYSPEQFETVKTHVNASLDLLSGALLLDHRVREGIAHHHERVDGTGYPNGLAGEDISLFGRMAAIADAYTALTSPRPHAAALSSYDAFQVLHQHAGTQFHAALVEEFVRAVSLFPVGSLVLLSSEQVAVVTAQDARQRLEPQVLVLTDSGKRALAHPVELVLKRKPKGPDGRPVRIARSLPAGVYGLDFRQFYIA